MKSKQKDTAKGKAKEAEMLSKYDKFLAEQEEKDAYFKEYKEKMESKCFNFMQTLKIRNNIHYDSIKDFIIDWFEQNYIYIENYYLSGKDLANIPIETKVMNHLYLLPPTSWPLRIHRHFISRLSQLKIENIYEVLLRLERIIDGGFHDSFRINLSINQTFFMTEFFVKRNFTSQFDLFYQVGLEQNPILNKNEDAITKFQFRQYIMIVDLSNRKTHFDSQYIKLKYDDLINDPARTNFRRDPDFVTNQVYQNRQYYDIKPYFFTEVATQNKGPRQYKSVLLEEEEAKLKEQQKNDQNQNNNQNDAKKVNFIPFKFNEHFLNFEESQKYEYDPTTYRWVLKEKKLLDEKFQEKEERAFQNKLILSSFADFSSASNLVELLQKIPNLKLKLTQEEIDVIGQDGNTLVIGRSGTGKTTCAMLRLFAMEVLFHIRVQIYISKNTKILQDSLTNEAIGMQSVFITASPVLANQIKKYYQKLVTQVKDEIKRKQELKKNEPKNESDVTDQESMNALTIQEASSFIDILTEAQDENTQLSQEEQFVTKELEKLSFLEQKNIQEEKEPENKDQGDEDEFEEDDLNDRFVMTEQGAKFLSLKDMKSQDFPAFLTVRQYLMLIEGCLHNPFFLKDQDGKLVHQEGSSSWGNYKSEKQMQKLNSGGETPASTEKQEEEFYDYDEENLDELYKRQMYLQSHQKFAEEIPDVEKLSPNDRKFEVDYNYFANAFWPFAQAKFKDSSLISCNTLFTEIYSYIKGSSKSFSYFERYMSKEDYLKLELNLLLSKEQKEVIYSMFEYYEKWKLQQKGYDLMDLVNYLLKEIQKKRCDLPSIHFTMIDEVQDLPYAIITLFSMVNEQNLFLAGDSAQTIARGVGFRFGDLRNVFSEFSHYFEKQLEAPTIRQLTVNFRSHNKILQLSNSVISLIEGLFPSTIDVLKKERSNIDGLKPIVLTDSDLGFLFTLLQGQQSEAGQIPLEFGCNQVIIVKDEESKKRLPAILQHAICLTIYEAKGLEFDDVILFNFFTDSMASNNQWDAVNLFNINKEKMSKETFLQMMTMHDSVFKKESILSADDPSFASAYGVEYNKEQDIVTINTVLTKSNELKAYNRIDNAVLSSELKQLYTAITRPKKRLIIFDTNTNIRKQIDKYWQKQNLVSFISQNDFENPSNGTNEDMMTEMQRKERQQIIDSVQKLLVKNTSEEWYEQGQKMFRFKYFEQAVKCFKKSGHINQEKKAQAYFEASTNSQLIVQIENNLSLLKKAIGVYSHYSEQNRKIAKNTLQKDLLKAKAAFVQIADKFLEINRKKQAAQCYFSGGEFEKAGQIYIEINQIREAAESFFLQGTQFEKAAKLYEQIKDIHKAIQCLDQIQDWNQILVLIQRNSSCFNSNEFKVITEKYTSLSFQTINSEIENAGKPQNDQEESDKPIEENESDESFSSFDSEHIEEKNEEDQLEESNIDQQIQEITFTENDNEEPQQSQSSKQSKSKQDNNTSVISGTSYSVVEKSKSESGITDMSFDHLSHIDPSDEWLRVENNSVFDKLNQSRISQSLSHSEFSILENSILGGEENFQIIKTKENINITNQVLVKILRLLAITDKTISNKLLQLLNIQSQEEEIVLDKDLQGNQVEFNGIENLDFDNLDKEFIQLILSRLEKYHQSKIALLICNRYKFYEKIGQILVSLALKYSPFSQSNAVVLATHFNSQLNFLVKKQKELSFVANTALHSVLESINPDLISKSVVQTKSDSLFNNECVRALLLLGYWKRIIFLIDRKTSLSIAQTFGDFNSYKILSQDSNEIITSATTKNLPKFNHLPKEEPNEDQQVQLAIMSLEHYIYHYIDKKFVPANSIKQLELPSYFKFNKFIWRVFNKVKPISQDKEYFETLQQLLSTAKSILDRSNKKLTQIQIFDAISAYHLLIAYDAQFQILSIKLPAETQSLLVQTSESLTQFLKYYTLKYDTQANQILRAIFTVYQIRVIPNNEALSIFGRDKVVIHKTNQLASSLIKNTKLIAEQGNMYYCDIDFENIIAPIISFSTKVATQAKQNVSSILNKLNSSNKLRNDENDNSRNKKQVCKNINLTNQQRLTQRIEDACQSVRYQLSDLQDKMVHQTLFLQYGQTASYNEKLFSIYSSNDNLIFEHFLRQILVNLVINYNANKKVNLLIPNECIRILQDLEDKQILLKDQQYVQDFKKQNPDVLLLNLNDFDNFEDFDEICQLILRAAEESSRKAKDNLDDDLEDDSDDNNNQSLLIDFIFLILANINDAEKESLKDLIKALNIINFNPVQAHYLKNNRNFKKILQSDSIDDMRDSTLDLIEEEEFDQYFGQWKNVTVFNNPKPEENDKLFKDLPNLVQKHIATTKKAGSTIYKFIVKNRNKLLASKQIYKHLYQYTDFFERYANNITEDYITEFKFCLVNTEGIHQLFEQLRNAQKHFLNLFYELRSINDDSMKLILDHLNQKEELFQQLSDLFNEIILKSISKSYKKFQFYQSIQDLSKQIFNKFGSTYFIINDIIRQNSAPAKPKKKIFEIAQGKQSIKNQKVLQLLRKRQNILKQERIQEMKQFKK